MPSLGPILYRRRDDCDAILVILMVAKQPEDLLFRRGLRDGSNNFERESCELNE